jgi:hypothetical protein
MKGRITNQSLASAKSRLSFGREKSCFNSGVKVVDFAESYNAGFLMFIQTELVLDSFSRERRIARPVGHLQHLIGLQVLDQCDSNQTQDFIILFQYAVVNLERRLLTS